VVLLDLDGFKAVNDRFGHSAGDEVLRVVSARLAREVEGLGAVARFGGDEFVLLLRHDPAWLRDRLRRGVSQPIPLGGGTVVTVGSSAGSAPVGPGGLSAALAAADERMYAHKRRRR
jgi:diguanylate cyclase (GGDEF)-like protein